MNLNYSVAPGIILKEYMESRNLSQKDLARLTESSERHISNLINGKVRLTEEYALKLEKVFDDVKAEFWMKLETNYKLYQLRIEKNNIEDLPRIAKELKFDYVFKDMNLSLKEQADRMLNILSLDSFGELNLKLNSLTARFMEDKGDKKVIYLWLKLCELEVDTQNNREIMNEFSITKLKDQLHIFKSLLYTTYKNEAIDNVRRLCNELGIYLVLLEAIPTSKVRGAVGYFNGHPAIYLSTRFKRLDTLYFAFIHEIAHILHDDLENTYEIMPDTDDEMLANQFARNYFVDQKAYKEFITISKVSLSEGDIISFSRSQMVIPEIIRGFLEHDGYIEHYQYRSLINKV